MFAIGRLRVAAAALAGSWLLVIVTDVVLAELAPARLVVAALALGNTVGQTVVAIPVVMAARRICGRAALQGVGRATLAGLAAGTVGTAVGVAICLAAPVSGKLLAAGTAVVAASCAVVAFGAVAYVLDRRDGDLKTVLARLRQVARPGH
jgi:putative peptidoglycan lipid II flippase